MSERATRLAAAGFLGGLFVGVVIWSREQHVHRRDLFSAKPYRRLAALAYLRGQRTPETARLLREYIRWEKRPALRRRAHLLLERVERHLD